MEYCRQYKDSKYTAENAALLAFADGAQWADENPSNCKQDPQQSFRMEVANTARRLFISEPTISMTDAFELAEKFALAKRAYMQTGNPIPQRVTLK